MTFSVNSLKITRSSCIASTLTVELNDGGIFNTVKVCATGIKFVLSESFLGEK